MTNFDFIFAVFFPLFCYQIIIFKLIIESELSTPFDLHNNFGEISPKHQQQQNCDNLNNYIEAENIGFLASLKAMNASLRTDYTTIKPNLDYIDPIQLLPLVLTRKHPSTEAPINEQQSQQQQWLLGENNNNKIYVHSLGLGKYIYLLSLFFLSFGLYSF